MRKICCICSLYCLLFLSEARDPCIGWLPSNVSGTCILRISTKLDFASARKECQTNRGDLVIISNDKMNRYIHETFAFDNANGHEKYYTGMSNRLSGGTGTFSWLDYDEEPHYQNWGSLQPSGMKTDTLCVVLNARDSRKMVWHDVKCNEQHRFICERTTDCPHGYFGPNCSLKCDLNCNGHNNVCQGYNGICHRSCDGHRQRWCQEECIRGAYGMNCKEDCSPNCAGGQTACDGVNGTCTSGCIPGYRGHTCDARCPNQTFGINCVNNCTNCAGEKNTDTCDGFDGACRNGCVAGYQGIFCNTRCPNQTFGINCVNNCTNCAGEKNTDTCDRFDGACRNGCVAGYQGIFCNTSCSNKTYGANCEKECANCASKNNADPCDRYNGACKHGCVSGYTGEFCQLKMSNEEREMASNQLMLAMATMAGLLFFLCMMLFLAPALIRRSETRTSLAGVELSETVNEGKECCDEQEVQPDDQDYGYPVRAVQVVSISRDSLNLEN